MQVGEEDIVQTVERHAGREVVGDRARTHVEDEIVAVAELDVYRGAHLSGPRQRRTAHEGHADFVGLDLFGFREPVRRALEPGHRCDPVEGEAFLPAAHGCATGRDRLQNLWVRFVALRGELPQLVGFRRDLRRTFCSCQHKRYGSYSSEAKAQAEGSDQSSVLHGRVLSR